MEWTKRNFRILLKNNGYILDRTKGSHFIYKNFDGNTISFNKDLNKMVAKRLIKEHKLIM